VLAFGPLADDRGACDLAVAPGGIEYVQDAQQPTVVDQGGRAGGPEDPVHAGVVLADQSDGHRSVEYLVVSAPQLGGELAVALELLGRGVHADQIEQHVPIDPGSTGFSRWIWSAGCFRHERITLDLTMRRALDTS